MFTGGPALAMRRYLCLSSWAVKERGLINQQPSTTYKGCAPGRKKIKECSISVCVIGLLLSLAKSSEPIFDHGLIILCEIG